MTCDKLLVNLGPPKADLSQCGAYTNCIKLPCFVRLAQMDGSLKHSAPPELVEGLGMACRPLCKAQHLITIAII